MLTSSRHDGQEPSAIKKTLEDNCTDRTRQKLKERLIKYVKEREKESTLGLVTEIDSGVR